MWLVEKKGFLLVVLLVLVFCAFKPQAQIITTCAGNGGTGTSGDGGAALAASIGIPTSGAFDQFGNYYFVGGVSNSRLRMVDTHGIIHTVAGVSTSGYSGDGGPATSAMLNNPYNVACDTFGNIYIADHLNYRIRKIDAVTMTISTVAGNGIAATTGDGMLATSASVVPYALCIDQANNVYFIDGYGTTVRKIDATGIITTVAGTGTGGFSGDGGPATNANLAMNYGICVDDANNLYLACDTRVRKVNLSTGIITTIAGTGSSAYVGEGIPATAASFNVYSLCINRVDTALYVADIGNDRVYCINSSGLFQLITGTGTGGFSGDGGTSTAAQVYNPEGVAVDQCGNLYIADGNNHRIRKVTFNPPTTPTITLAGGASASVGATVTVTATVSGAGSDYVIKWFRNGVFFTSTTTPIVTYTKGSGDDAITARVVPEIIYCYDSTTSLEHIVAESDVAVRDLVSQNKSYVVYPNPAGNTVHVTSNAAIRKLSISDIIGRTVIKQSGQSKDVTIDISNLPKGMYILRLNDNYTQKVLKQ